MAEHSTSGATSFLIPIQPGDVTIFEEKNIKREPIDKFSTVNVNGSNMGAYTQLSTSNQEFVRLPNNYIQTDNSGYSVITTQGNNSSNKMQKQPTIKYEPVDDYIGSSNTITKTQDRYGKYTKGKKLHQTNSSPISEQKKRKTDKAGKGLRHFSMKVCEKVKEKGTTTYNEVADELVAEEIQNDDTANCDQKNIRRRVYDALNVLMAMQIISKDKKEIRWKGLPTNSAEQCLALEKENEERRRILAEKNGKIRELLLKTIVFKCLVERNKEAERQGNIPTTNSSIQLPFIIVNTFKTTNINCSVTNDKSEYTFKFNEKFEMHDDAEVLKRMGLLLGLDKGQCSEENIERAKSLVPANFEKYIEAYGKGRDCSADSDDDTSNYIDCANQSTQHFVRNDGIEDDLDDDDYVIEDGDDD